jgi:hypothetical protein
MAGRILPLTQRQERCRGRRFPPPWSVEETGACFIVRQTLAQVYFEEQPERRLTWMKQS